MWFAGEVGQILIACQLSPLWAENRHVPVVVALYPELASCFEFLRKEIKKVWTVQGVLEIFPTIH